MNTKLFLDTKHTEITLGIVTVEKRTAEQHPFTYSLQRENVQVANPDVILYHFIILYYVIYYQQRNKQGNKR